MSDYKLKIEAYSPATIPMERLAKYMSALAALLGEADRVHFAGLDGGSTGILAQVDNEARGRVIDRVQTARSSEESSKVRRPIDDINALLSEDNTDGKLLLDGAEIIEFPGRKRLHRMVGPIWKGTEVAGVLVRIGGRDKTSHAQIENFEGKTWNCELTRDTASRLAPYLYGSPIRVYGDGRWVRLASGLWLLDQLKVKDFSPIEARSLAEEVNAIRAVGVKLVTASSP
jgi:hypothetical protein